MHKVVAYRGTRVMGETSVLVEYDDMPKGLISRPLPRRLDVRNHSPTGFEWGYGGSGPAQLALAILLHWGTEGGGDLTQDQVLSLYQEFKWQKIGSLPREGFRLTVGEIAIWLVDHQRRRAG